MQIQQIARGGDTPNKGEDMVEMEEHLLDSDEEYMEIRSENEDEEWEEKTIESTEEMEIHISQDDKDVFYEGGQRPPQEVEQALLLECSPLKQPRVSDLTVDMDLVQGELKLLYGESDDESTYEYEEVEEPTEILPISKHERRSFFCPPNLKSISESNDEEDEEKRASLRSLNDDEKIKPLSNSTAETTLTDTSADDLGADSGDDNDHSGGVESLEERTNPSDSEDDDDVLRAIGDELGLDADAVKGLLRKAVAAIASGEDTVLSQHSRKYSSASDGSDVEIRRTNALAAYLNSPVKAPKSKRKKSKTPKAGKSVASGKSNSARSKRSVVSKAKSFTGSSKSKKSKTKTPRSGASVMSAPGPRQKDEKKKKKKTRKLLPDGEEKNGSNTDEEASKQKSVRRRSGSKSKGGKVDDPETGKKSGGSSRKLGTSSSHSRSRSKSTSKRKLQDDAPAQDDDTNLEGSVRRHRSSRRSLGEQERKRSKSRKGKKKNIEPEAQLSEAFEYLAKAKKASKKGTKSDVTESSGRKATKKDKGKKENSGRWRIPDLGLDLEEADATELPVRSQSMRVKSRRSKSKEKISKKPSSLRVGGRSSEGKRDRNGSYSRTVFLAKSLSSMEVES